MLASAAPRPTSLEELVPPDLASVLDRLEIHSRRLLPGKLPGERRSKRRGQSVEFADHRAYVPGDDLRRIDWHVLARLDRLVLKIFQEEQDLAVRVALDVSPSMDAGDGHGAGGPADNPTHNKLVLARRLAMALAYTGLVRNSRVTLTCFGGPRLEQSPPLRGRHSLARLAAFLLAVGAPRTPAGRQGSRGDFAAAMRALAGGGGGGVVIVISDFLFPEGYQAGLRYLAGGPAGLDGHCLQVLSPGELDPGRLAPAGLLGDLEFLDAETGRAANVTITPAVVAGYRDSVRAYTATLRAEALRRGLRYQLVTSDTPAHELLLGALRRGGLLG